MGQIVLAEDDRQALFVARIGAHTAFAA